MAKHKKYIDIWLGKKNISLINYKAPWKENGNPPMFNITTNGAKRKKGDTCLDIQIYFGYLVFTYTDFDLQKRG